MIITFPFEDDPYYSAAQPPSYTRSQGAALTTPALVRKYIDLAKHVAGGVFPVGMNRFWHGGVHLSGTRPIRAVADGTIVAYRLETDYRDSALAALVASAEPRSSKPAAPRQFSGSFVLIRHECEKNNGATAINRYTGAHFYSLYANVMPAREMNDKRVLPPFVTTGENLVPVSALRGDEVTVLAVNSDGHRMTKVRVMDINNLNTVEGWIEQMYLDIDPAVPLAVAAKVRIGYPISWLFANHPSEKKWRALDCVKRIEYPVRVGEVIGYAGKTDTQLGVLPDSFHFEIFTAENLLVRPMKSLRPLDVRDPGSSHQDYVDGGRSDGMGKVWLTRDARLARRNFFDEPPLTLNEIDPFPAGSCFISAIPCGVDGLPPNSVDKYTCFKLIDVCGKSYYAYADNVYAAADGRSIVRDAWVTLTTDSDWPARGWQAYLHQELNAGEDGFVEDDDAVMRKILNAAHKSSASLNLDDLHSEGVDAILRNTVVRFHTEWDSDHNDARYQKLKTGSHPSLPHLTDGQFSAFIQDAQSQQFWSDAKVMSDGISGADLKPRLTSMRENNWHFHPIGFLAQMRECLTTDVKLSEETFEQEIRRNWNIGLKLIDIRLKQLAPWTDPNAPAQEAPTPIPVVQRQYAISHKIENKAHKTLWENFMYWFGVDLNTIAAPETLHGSLAGAPAGHHVYAYLQGMRMYFKHLSMQRIVKGALGFAAGAWVHPGIYARTPLVPAKAGFLMEHINIGCQYGYAFAPFNAVDAVEQNRMEVQLHEIAHLRNTAHAADQRITLPAGTPDPDRFNNKTAYGARAARVLAEFSPNRALANAENIAFFIESAKDEPNVQV